MICSTRSGILALPDAFHGQSVLNLDKNFSRKQYPRA